MFVVPYPPSDRVLGIRWLSEPLLYPDSFGDVWSGTWADDGNVYTATDDTTGIGKNCNSNLAIFRVSGNPPGHTLELVNPMPEYGVIGHRIGIDCWKANGLASIDGVLYLSISRHSYALKAAGGDQGNYDIRFTDGIQRTFDATIVKSSDHGQTWTPWPAGHVMFPGPSFSNPFFVQFGQDYQGAMDEYVYAISATAAWNNGNMMVLGRVRRDLIGQLDGKDWQFYQGMDEAGKATWGKMDFPVQAIFKHRGMTSMTGMQYVPAAGRFILPQWAYTNLDGPRPFRRTMLALYEAPRPWGPWRHVHTEPDWGYAYYNPTLCPRWFEEGGRRLWLTAAGNFTNEPGTPFSYGFIAQKLELVL